MQKYKYKIPKSMFSLLMLIGARHAYRMIFSSKSAHNMYKQYYKHPRPIFIANAIDQDIFNTVPLSAQEVQEIENSLKDKLQSINNTHASLKHPCLLCVARIAPEKNLDVFFKIQFDGTKIIIGDGPLLEDYKKKYKDVIFLGEIKNKQSLAKYYKYAAGLYTGGANKRGVFVFPSMSETFGVVMLEAMGCGLGVAAFKCPGPIDVITENINGIMVHVPNGDDNTIEWQDLAAQHLGSIIQKAIDLDQNCISESIRQYTWDALADKWHQSLCYIPKKLRKQNQYKFNI